MIRNALIAVTAAAALGVALAPAAQAKSSINIDVDFGFGGFYDGHRGHHGFNDDYGWYGDDCHYVKVKHKKWNKSHTKKKIYFTKKLVCY